MHLIVPFAGPLGDAGVAALQRLALPRLQALLSRWPEVARDAGDETSYSTPHERALAAALGFTGGDGRLPWAAWLAQADGVQTGAQAWGLVSPGHWHLGTDQVSLIDPATLQLDDASSRALFAAVEGLFTSEGFTVQFGAPARWYIAHASLAALRCASLDRVIGRNVDGWLTADPAVRLVRRLQNEVQMLLYTHPLNDAREAQGLLPVNSFWLSGCGVAQPVSAGAAPQVDARLRGPALADDWAGWQQAWQLLDDGPIQALLAAPAPPPGATPTRLTLCGERASASFEAGGRRNGWQRLRSRWSPAPAPAAVLAAL